MPPCFSCVCSQHSGGEDGKRESTEAEEGKCLPLQHKSTMLRGLQSADLGRCVFGSGSPTSPARTLNFTLAQSDQETLHPRLKATLPVCSPGETARVIKYLPCQLIHSFINIQMCYQTGSGSSWRSRGSSHCHCCRAVYKLSGRLHAVLL